MKRLYICFPSEDIEPEDIHIIWAKDEDECLDLLADNQKDDYLLQEYILDRAINMSLAESFYSYCGKWIFDSHMERCGCLLPEIECIFEDDEEIGEWIEELFESNVREFFPEKLADAYLHYYYNEYLDEPEYFDEICFHVARSSDWCSWVVSEIELPDNVAAM
ncbi:hypothetical protein [Ammoniphilus resinae]|uniref:Antirestriction protein n=1 Tax=Ammoniphilus resinae TaxID=861532 RepID=A0ABS4GXM9_9BACL|nr:hypothetical protein [Ammoniphilus resinae]MBP1935024.1 hypothetical protein [Ammoniphilus resinae]